VETLQLCSSLSSVPGRERQGNKGLDLMGDSESPFAVWGKSVLGAVHNID